MDEGLKRDFSQFCENIGMTMSTAFVVFAKAALRSRKIPFEIYDYTGSPESEKASIRLEAKRAFECQSQHWTRSTQKLHGHEKFGVKGRILDAK